MYLCNIYYFVLIEMKKNILILTSVLLITMCIKGQERNKEEELNFFKEFSAVIDSATRGIGYKLNITDSTEHIVNLSLNFRFSKKALQIITKSVSSDSSLQTYNSLINKDYFTLVFENIKFKYNPEVCVFISDSILYISSINDSKIGKILSGYIAFLTHSSGPSRFFLFLSGVDYYYFFNYHNLHMSSYSSNIQFMESIAETPPRKRKHKKSGYSYYLSSERRVRDFLHSICLNEYPSLFQQ